MICGKLDPETNTKCKGIMRPFGKKEYHYIKCDICGSLRIAEEKQVKLI